MASVGLWTGARALGVARQAQFALGRPLQREAAPCMASAMFHTSQKQLRKQDSLRIHIQEVGLISEYIPPPWSHMPPVTLKTMYPRTRQYLRETFVGIFSSLSFKLAFRGWQNSRFATEGEELYDSMNEAFAEGDIKYLEHICMPNMLSNLKANIKARSGPLRWRKVRTLSTPKVVQARIARISAEYRIGQVTIRIDQEQQVMPSRSSPRSKAKPKTVHVREYVVFQRPISEKNSVWSICGKMPVPSWDLP
ncbi:hypothetical protein GGF46_000413 [Coemansia sp. RSA 552]|nr:hypothetical protein GGF46_000413 [Coemansia sp. RSA 552]